MSKAADSVAEMLSIAQELDAFADDYNYRLPAKCAERLRKLAALRRLGASAQQGPTKPVEHPEFPHRLPCGCEWQRTYEDKGGPIFWNPFNGVVQCHKCGHSFFPVGASGVDVREWIRHKPECSALGEPAGYEWNPDAESDRACTCGLSDALRKHIAQPAAPSSGYEWPMCSTCGKPMITMSTGWACMKCDILKELPEATPGKQEESNG